MLKRCKWSLAALLLSCLSVAQAALLDEARVISANESLSSMVPQVESITIATAGIYTLTLTDLQHSGPANPFSSLSVVISQGAQLIKHLPLPSSEATASASVTLVAGQYQVQVLGVTTGASQYGVDLKNSSNVSVWSDSGIIAVPPGNNFSSLQHTLSLTVGQSYSVTLSDRAFPVALNSLALIVTESGSQAGNCNLTAGGTCSFVATADSAVLTVVADKGVNSAGMYSVKVINSGASIVYGATLPVGDMPEPVSITLPANDTYAFTSSEIITPDTPALATFKVALVQGGEVPVNQSAVGGPINFSGNSGTASLYVIATPAPNSAGLYSVVLKRGTATVYSKLNSVTDAASSGLEGYVFTANLPAAGTYSLQLRDFIFPQSFTTLSAKVTQGTTSLGGLSAAGSMSITAMAAGEISIAILTKPATSTDPTYIPAGLFGITLTASGTTTPLLEQTQGVGGRFTSQVVTVPATGHYAIKATDFVAPQALDQLLVAVTRGSQLIGSMYGGGTFEFDPTAGDYTLSFIAKAKTGGYGLYGISLVAAPTVTLSANMASIASGGSATLTWSATDATSCTASGGWSGSRAGSGSASVGPLTADTTFTLTCTNTAGSTATSTTVTVQATTSSKKKGGGAWSLGWLLAFGILSAARRLRSRGD